MGRFQMGLEGGLVIIHLIEPDAIFVACISDYIEASAARLIVY